MNSGKDYVFGKSNPIDKKNLPPTTENKKSGGPPPTLTK